MKIHEYNEMMAYLLRPKPRQMLSNGGLSTKQFAARQNIYGTDGLRKLVGPASRELPAYKVFTQALKNAVIHTHPRSKAAKTYFNISKRILGEDVDFVDPKNLGLVGRFLQSIGLR